MYHVSMYQIGYVAYDIPPGSNPFHVKRTALTRLEPVTTAQCEDYSQ